MCNRFSTPHPRYKFPHCCSKPDQAEFKKYNRFITENNSQVDSLVSAIEAGEVVPLN